MVKNLPANEGDTGSIPGLGRSPRFPGSGNSLQYSCLENPMDRGDCGYSSWSRKESNMTKHTHTHICHMLICVRGFYFRGMKNKLYLSLKYYAKLMKQDHTLEARMIKFLVSSNACSTGKIQNRIGFSI